MTNSDKYANCFITTFGVNQSEVSSLAYQSINEWDSVGHMALMAQIEDELGISLEMDDVIDFSSFQKGKELIAKYGITFDD